MQSVNDWNESVWGSPSVIRKNVKCLEDHVTDASVKRLEHDYSLNDASVLKNAH